MFKANKWVIPYVVILSVALLIPAVIIPLADHEARQKWENRTLTKPPDLTKVLTAPKQTFSQLDDYVDDHIGGGFQVIKARRKFYFYFFNSTSNLYILENNKGALFMTAPFEDVSRDNPFSWWKNLCLEAQEEERQKYWTERLRTSQKLLGKDGAKVVYGMVPTKSVLLNNDLPRSTPKEIISGCGNITADNNHTLKIKETAPDLELFFPLAAFKKRVSDPLFYPNTSYHWQGESSWVFTEELAKQYNLNSSPVWPTEPCKPQMVNWDIGQLIGVGDSTMGCDRDRNQLGIIVDQQFEYPLFEGADKESVFVVKMTNPHATNTDTAIVFSNSFGPVVRELVASHFQTTYHLRGGFVSAPDMQRLFYESDILETDFIITTIADFHYPGFLDWISPAVSSKKIFSPEVVAAAEKKDRKLRARLKKANEIKDEKNRIIAQNAIALEYRIQAREEERQKHLADFQIQKAEQAAEKAKAKALRVKVKNAERKENLVRIELRKNEVAEQKRLSAVEKAKEIELRIKALSDAREEKRIKGELRKKEAAELRAKAAAAKELRIEARKAERQEKLAKIEQRKKEIAEQKSKAAEARELRIETRKAEREEKLAKAEQRKKEVAEQRVKTAIEEAKQGADD